MTQRRCRRARGANPGVGRGAAAGVGRPCTRLGLCVFLPGGFRAGVRGERSCWPLRVWWGRPAWDTVQSPLRRTLEAPAAGGGPQPGSDPLPCMVGGGQQAAACLVCVAALPSLDILHVGPWSCWGPWQERDQHPGWTAGTPGAETWAEWPVAAVRPGVQAVAGDGVCP